MERDSEYNRLNSSHYDSDGSQLSFRRDGNNPSDEHSSHDHPRLMAAGSLHQLSSHDSLKSFSPQKSYSMHRRHPTDATGSDMLAQDYQMILNYEMNDSSPQPQKGYQTERIMRVSPKAQQKLNNEMFNLPQGSENNRGQSQPRPINLNRTWAGAANQVL